MKTSPALLALTAFVVFFIYQDPNTAANAANQFADLAAEVLKGLIDFAAAALGD